MPADRTMEHTPFHSPSDPIRLKASRKRGTPGACDYCKRKKVRCNGSEMPGNRCSNCIAAGNECTHEEVLKNLRSMREYVEVLEGRLKKMDKLLNEMIPGVNFAAVGMEPSLEEDRSKDSPVARNDDELDELVTKLNTLRLNPKQNYFWGKSSGHQLFQTAWEVKEDSTVPGKYLDKERWICKRPEFWEVPSWIKPHPAEELDSPLYIFPESDLLMSLVDLYFTHLNTYLPLLHRPTFEKSLDEKEHYRDHTFGATVMLVCAIGSRFSNDPRVFMEGSGSTTSAGWKWYCQVNVLRKSVFKRTTVYELQMFALSVLYGRSSHVSEGMWTQVGMGLRLAQEVGAHRRRKALNGRPNAENELWKRAFWVLMCIDRFISSYSGRPCGVQEEDFDLDLPVECDDEYWDEGFIQPLWKPSKLSFFISYLKLMDIRAYAMRVVYPIRRPENLYGKAVHLSQQEIIAELDSALNKWMDSIPNHLRWNPNCTDQLLFKQSVALHASYYDLQILIHRPFIPSPRNPQPGIFPSLAICSNAARMCSHVLDYYNKSNTLLLPQFQVPAAHSAIILLMNIWSGKKTGLALNPQRELDDIGKLTKLLKAAESRWCLAGRFVDVINELAWAGELPLEENSPGSGPSTDEGCRMDLSNNANSPAEYLETISPIDSARSISSSFESMNRASAQLSFQKQEQGIKSSLPVYTTELGKLPIYGQSRFTNTNPMQRLDDNPFAAPVVSPQQNRAHDASQYLEMAAPVEFVDNGSQNVFTAADFFVKNALFQGGKMTNNDTMFYSSSTTPLTGVHPDVVLCDNAVEFGGVTPSYGINGEDLTSQETYTSPAASIFAEHGKNWIYR